MQAVAVFPQERAVRLVDHPEPRITQPDEVKIRILDVGICGTDREIAAFEYGEPPAGSRYLILGHEALGEVVEAGQAVKALTPGDLAVPMVRRPCSHARCRACRAGRQDFCLSGDFTERGIKGAHGFLTELVVDRERYLKRVPEALREVGVLVEPLTIAEKALLEIREIEERLPAECRHFRAREQRFLPDHAVVLGAGAVGLLGAMSLVAAGYDTYVYSRGNGSTPRALLSQSIGATYVSAQVLDMDGLAARVGSLDLVYEATGSSRTSFQLLERLGPNGVFVLTGVPRRGKPVEMDTDLLMRNLVLRNQVVLGTVNAGPDAYQSAIAELGTFLQRWPQPLRSLISGRYPLGSYADLLFHRGEGIKDVITPAGLPVAV